MPIQIDTALAAVLAFAAWTFLHVVVITMNRSLLINTGRAKTNAFGPSRDEPGTSFYGRVCASHANCIENLVLFSAIVLALHELTNGGNVIGLPTLAWRVVYLRIGQSLAHWYDVTEGAVTVRFLFFMGQFVSMGTMLYRTFALE